MGASYIRGEKRLMGVFGLLWVWVHIVGKLLARRFQFVLSYCVELLPFFVILYKALWYQVFSVAIYRTSIVIYGERVSSPGSG